MHEIIEPLLNSFLISFLECNRLKQKWIKRKYIKIYLDFINEKETQNDCHMDVSFDVGIGISDPKNLIYGLCFELILFIIYQFFYFSKLVENLDLIIGQYLWFMIEKNKCLVRFSVENVLQLILVLISLKSSSQSMCY